MKHDAKLALRGTTSFFEQTDFKINEKMKNGGFVFLNMPVPVGCNYNCPKCFSGGSDIYRRQLMERGGSMEFDLDLRERMIVEAKTLGAKTLVIGGAGEPLMFPELEKVLEITSLNEMYTVLFTNGSLLSKRRAEGYFSRGVSLVFSFDAISSRSYDRLTDTKKNYGKIIENLKSALNLSEKYSFEQSSCKVAPLAVNTNVTLLTYNPTYGINEIKRIKNLIDNRAVHFVSNIIPTGNARSNWDWLVGTTDFSSNPVLKEAERIYSKGFGGSSRRKDGQCAYLHNGITIYEGHYMMCPNVGLQADFGKYPDVSIAEHFEAKKGLLRKDGSPLCAIRR